MFTTFIVKPIFNLLVLIYSILPGHNFGLALIIFTIVVRMLMWPLIKKQLHQAKGMRALQPDIKRIKKVTKGNRQQEQLMMMELYKEKGINPFSTFPILIVQLVILIGLYSGLRRVINDPHAIVNFAYPALQHTTWLQQLSHNIHRFDDTLFGLVNLNRAALSKGGVYWPAMLIVLGSAIAQYFQSKQLLPNDKEQRSLRGILKQAGEGKQADQAEINAAVGRSTRFLLPVMIFFFTVNIASALSLYWLVGGVVAYIQQAIVLRSDETEMEAIADRPGKDPAKIPEAEIVEPPQRATKAAKTKKTAAKNKRRKR